MGRAILNRFQEGPACNVNEKLYQIVQKSRWPSLLSAPQKAMCYFNYPFFCSQQPPRATRKKCIIRLLFCNPFSFVSL